MAHESMPHVREITDGDHGLYVPGPLANRHPAAVLGIVVAADHRVALSTVMVSVRRATSADVDSVRRVGFATWPATYGPLLGDEYVQRGLATWWSADRVLRGITDNTTYIAQVGDDVVGTAVVGVLDETPMLWKLYVLPDDQKTGAGRALLDAVIAGLDVRADRLWLDHAEGNDNAHGFYERHGFRELFRHQDEHGHREVRMERQLR